VVFGFHSVVDAIDAYIGVERQLDAYNTAHNVSSWALTRPKVEFLEEHYSSRGVWHRSRNGNKSGGSSVLRDITIKEEADSATSSVVGE